MFSRCLLLTFAACFIGCAGAVSPPKDGGPKAGEAPADQPPKAAQSDKPAPKADPPVPDLSKTDVRQGDLAVTLRASGVSKVRFRIQKATVDSDEECFWVAIYITNQSKVRRLEYRGWATQRPTLHLARLTDEHGNRYKRISSGAGSGASIEGQIDHATINPGEYVTDLLVFEKPLDVAARLTLDLPLDAFEDHKGTATVTVPRAYRRPE